jgi:hypothetical protein
MDTHHTTTGKLLVVGDINFHFDQPQNRDTNRINEILELNGLQHVSEPTHKKGHTLDIVIT